MAKVVCNGDVLEESEAAVPALDWGVLYGFGLFETMRSYGGRIFKLEKHLERLFDSSAKIGLNIKKTRSDLSRYIYLALDANGFSDAYVRLTVTFGVGGTRFGFPDEPAPNVFVVAQPLPDDLDKNQKAGVSCALSSFTRDPNSPLTYVKSTNYLLNVLAKREARDLGVYDVVLLNTGGFVSETSSANIFLVKDGAVETPSIKSGIIPGVTRKTLIEVAGDLGFECVEREITKSQLSGADEIFVTNSVMEIAPVVELDGEAVGSGFPGEVTLRLLEEYRKLTQ